MSFWSNLFGSRNNGETTHLNGTMEIAPDIPEETFIEKTSPEDNEDSEVERKINQDNIHLLYGFLSKDFQTQGYEDALINPDTSYMTQNVDTIMSEFDMLIRRVKTYYEDALMELEFLILSRSRLGMVDTVDELNMKKDKANRHMEKVKEMELEIDEQKGTSERIIISYKRGFHKGMAAIAHHESNKRKF